MVIVGLIASAVLAAAFVGSLVATAGDPERTARLYNERRWIPAQRWLTALSLAALAGTALAGGGEESLGVVAVIGLLLTWLCSRFVTNAAMNRRHSR